VLEVILENFCCEGWTYFAGGPEFRTFGAHHFSAAEYFSGGEARDFYRQYQVDFQLSVGLERFLGMEKQAGTADVFRGSGTPGSLAYRTIAEWEMKVEAARAEWRNFSLASIGAGLSAEHHHFLRDRF
jgi:hypothetical protein